MAKTKRRKVWVLSDESDGHRAFSFDPLTAKAKAYWSRKERTCTLFVEARPGDVVLSREDRDRLLTLVEEAARDEGRDSEREALIVSLLRGRR